MIEYDELLFDYIYYVLGGEEMKEQLNYILNELSKIDYESIMHDIISLTCLITADKAISSLRINKDFKIKDISKVCVTPELKQKYSNVSLEHITSQKIKDITLEFANLLIEKFPPDYLINFYNNINEVKIEKSIAILLRACIGTYSNLSNKIDVFAISTLYHELFHMASCVNKSILDENGSIMYFTGFHQHNDIYTFEIGRGLNEGYTELLTQRYFGDKHKLPKTYKHVVNIAEKLEIIIGKDKMESLYFNANLSGLINELKKYSTEDEIAKFISRVDLIMKHSVSEFRSKKMEQSIKDVYDFLFKTYVKKLKQQYEDGKISLDEFIKQSTEYTRSLGTSAKMKWHKYKYLTLEDVLNNIEDISKSPDDVQNNQIILKI